MSALRVAFALIRVRQLFFSLLFWPLVVGFFFAVSQLAFAKFYMRVTTETPEQFRTRALDSREYDMLFEYLYGVTELPQLQVCRWLGDMPPAGCEVKPYDVAVHTPHPETFSSLEIEKFFSGATRTVHICSNCTADIVITPNSVKNTIDVSGIPAIGVFSIADNNFGNYLVDEYFVEARRDIEKAKKLKGNVFLHVPGVRSPMNITEASRTMILVMNTAFLIIIALWLSLRAHRKVLDYFVKNDALLPMVAACGKKTFYDSLWIITLLRVGCFLIASIPVTSFLYTTSVPRETLNAFVGTGFDFFSWTFALIACLSLVTITASIGELKQRSSFLSFLYRWVPLTLFLFGSMIWVISLIDVIPGGETVSLIVTSIPVIGLSPVILFPLLRTSVWPLLFSAIVSFLLSASLLRSNANWFAAHLEEI